MYYDSSSLWLYLVLVLPAFIISLAANRGVKSAYKKYSRVLNMRGMTGEEAARRVLGYYGVTGVGIAQIDGTLSDNFNPRTNVISLSADIYHGRSVAAVCIAAHEAGHAAQYAQGYVPIKVRNSILPVCNIGSYAGIPLALLGYFLGFEPLIIIGLALYSAIAVFQLATLPVEFDASKRALSVIEETGMLASEDENKGAKRVLRAAALTYVAALGVTLANLLRYIIMFSGRRRR